VEPTECVYSGAYGLCSLWTLLSAPEFTLEPTEGSLWNLLIAFTQIHWVRSVWSLLSAVGFTLEPTEYSLWPLLIVFTLERTDCIYLRLLWSLLRVHSGAY